MTFDFNAFYSKKEDEIIRSKSREDAKMVDLYNNFVLKVQDLLNQIIKQAEIKPPKDWQWVVIGGKKTASWKIWEYKSTDEHQAYDWSVNLLPDGKLVAIDNSRDQIPMADIEIKPISSLSERLELKVGGNYDACNLQKLYDSIYAKKAEFGITLNKFWPEKSPTFR